MQRTILITGGAKGIGAFISHAFHANGDCVLVASRSDNGFADQLGERARFVACDVRRPADLYTGVQAALEWTRRLGVFVN